MRIGDKLHGAIRRLTTAISYIVLGYRNVSIGQNVQFDGVPIVSSGMAGQIAIGDKCFLASRSSGTALGVRSRIILRLLNPQAQIRIGVDTGLSGTIICSAMSISIGQRCMLGADVMIFDTDFHDIEPLGRRHGRPDWEKISSPVVIGDDVFVGARSIIAKGVTIGSGSVIGAGSVVTSDIPPLVIAAGVPAQVIRKIRSEKAM